MVFDIIVIVALIISALIAFLRGFIREVLTILGVVGGAAAAYFLGPLASPEVQEWIGSGSTSEDGKVENFMGMIPYPLLADGIAYGTIFIIFVIMLSVISHFLAEGAKSVGLGALDRTFGVIFGIARGVLLLALMYLPVYLMVEEKIRKEWFTGCRSCIYVDMTATWISATWIPRPEESIEKAKEGAKSLASETREKLENLEILNPNTPEKMKIQVNNEKRDQKGDSGYKSEQRRNLQDLFEENMNE